jgi:hypothetical protein
MGLLRPRPLSLEKWESNENKPVAGRCVEMVSSTNPFLEICSVNNKNRECIHVSVAMLQKEIRFDIRLHQQ